MKIRLYMDVWQGFDFRQLEWCPMVQVNPLAKPEGNTRIAFDLLIPDDLVDRIRGVDVLLPEEATAEIVK